VQPLEALASQFAGVFHTQMAVLDKAAPAVQGLVDQTEELRKAVSKEKGEVERLRKGRDEARAQLKVATAKVAELEEQIANSQAATLLVEKAAATAMVTQLQQELAEKAAENQHLRASGEQGAQHLVQSHNEATTLRGQVERLQTELAQAQHSSAQAGARVQQQLHTQAELALKRIQELTDKLQEARKRGVREREAKKEAVAAMQHGHTMLLRALTNRAAQEWRAAQHAHVMAAGGADPQLNAPTKRGLKRMLGMVRDMLVQLDGSEPESWGRAHCTYTVIKAKEDVLGWLLELLPRQPASEFLPVERTVLLEPFQADWEVSDVAEIAGEVATVDNMGDIALSEDGPEDMEEDMEDNVPE